MFEKSCDARGKGPFHLLMPARDRRGTGDPNGIRTRVSAVKGRCPNRWTIGSFLGKERRTIPTSFGSGKEFLRDCVKSPHSSYFRYWYELEEQGGKLGMPNQEPDPSDVNDREREWLGPLVAVPEKLGRPPRQDRRLVLNAIFHVVRSGCAWRRLPHDLPPWRLCYYYFAKWRESGLWQEINDHLRRSARR